MREAIELLAIEHPGIEPAGVVTVSAGIACYREEGGDDVAKLLARADAALYDAKGNGRNRVVTRERKELLS
jgi:diguanylate cyclase (GGDEF)-like protein